jgi:ribosomal protein S20
MRTKTAKKELRKSLRRNDLNNMRKRNLKKIKSKLLHTITVSPNENIVQKTNQDFSNFTSILAKMAKVNLIHPNKAARLISRMDKKIKKAQINIIN